MKESRSPEEPVKKSSSGKLRLPPFPSLLSVVVFVMALLGILLSAYLGFTVHVWKDNVTQLRQQVEQQLTKNQTQLHTFESSLHAMSTQQATLQQQVARYQSVILPIIHSKEFIYVSDTQWELQKIESWLEQAQLDLHASENFPGAVLLLNAANAALKDLMERAHLTSLQATQASLEENMAVLSAIPPVDEMALLVRIQELSHQLQTLPAPINSEEMVELSGSRWEKIAQQAWYSVKKFVVIKPANEQGSRTQWNNNLQLALHETEWALITKNNVLFHWGLKQVESSIQEGGAWIDLRHPHTLSCLTQLKELETQNLAPVLPDLTPAIQQLQVIITDMTAAKSAA